MTRPKRHTREQAEAATAAAAAQAAAAEEAKQQAAAAATATAAEPPAPQSVKIKKETTAGPAAVAAPSFAASTVTSTTSATLSSTSTSNSVNTNGSERSQLKSSIKKKSSKKKKGRGNWHSSSDERMRRSVIEQIMQLLAQCKKSTNQNAKAKLVNLARRLEAALYRAASSKAQYNKLEKDPAVLRQKVRQLARESATKRAILSAATPEAAAAIAATAGASLEEQKKIKEQHLRILRQRQRLLLLRHGSRCRIPIGHKCQVTPHCAVMQKLWQHIAQCKMQQCDYPHCVASRHVLAHYRRCSDLHCLVCGPVRHAAMQSLNAARQQAPHQGYRKPGLLEALGHDQLQQHIQDCRQERLYQLLTVLLRKIVEHRSNRELFNSPVDAVALNIPKYLEIIKRPMDLGTIRKKLENQKYTHHTMFAEDVRLVFENARTFNPKTHPIHEAASDLLNSFQTEYFRLVQRIDPKVAEQMLKSNKGPVVKMTPTKSHKKGASNHHKKKTHTLTKVSSSSSSRASSSQMSGRSFEAPRKHGVCTLCQQQVCEQCPMCEAGCLPFEAPALHCRGTCGSRVQRNSSFWALPSTNYFVWCTMCHDNLRPDHPYPIANRTIKKEMLVKKKNNQVQGEPWVQCDMCNKWMHQICVIFNARAEARYSNGRFVCPLCRHKVMAEDAKMREDERKAALLAKQAAADGDDDAMVNDMLGESGEGESKNQSGKELKIATSAAASDSSSSSSASVSSSSASLSVAATPRTSSNAAALKGELPEDNKDDERIPAQSPRASPLGSPRARGDSSSEEEDDRKSSKSSKNNNSKSNGSKSNGSKSNGSKSNGSKSNSGKSNGSKIDNESDSKTDSTTDSNTSDSKDATKDTTNTPLDPATAVAAMAKAAKEAQEKEEKQKKDSASSSSSSSCASNATTPSNNDKAAATSNVTASAQDNAHASSSSTTAAAAAGATPTGAAANNSKTKKKITSPMAPPSPVVGIKKLTLSAASAVKGGKKKGTVEGTGGGGPAPSPRAGPPATPRTADTAAQKLLHGERPPGSRELPQSPMGAYIEQSVRKMIQQEIDAAKQGERSFTINDAPGPEEIVIRTVSNIAVPHQLPGRLSARTVYPKDLKYQSKAVMMFQRDSSDIDQALFAMYVQEYDEHSDGSNRRMAYIAYLDSVSYMRPKTLRTKIYHQILLAYMEWIKTRGFCAVYIWACPPPHKRDDYILHVHPDTQRMPSAERLRRWYHTMIDEGSRSGLVLEKTTLYHEHLQYHFLTNKERSKMKQKRARSKANRSTKRLKRDVLALGNATTKPITAPTAKPPIPSDKKNGASTRKRTRSTRSSGAAPEPPPPPPPRVKTKTVVSTTEDIVLEPDLGLGPPPARIPYFDGDFWPIEAEELLLEFRKEAEKAKADAAEAKAEEGRSTRKKRRVTLSEEARADQDAASKKSKGPPPPVPLPVELRPKETKRMFEKLANRMAHMKRDFLLVKLQHNCANCHEYIISGNRYSCEECSRKGKPFNLCEKCYQLEEDRMAVEGEEDDEEGEEDEEGDDTDVSSEDDGSPKRKRSLHRSRVEFLSITAQEAAKEQAARAKHKKRKSDSSSSSSSSSSNNVPGNTKVAGAMELSEDVSMQWDSKIHKMQCIEVTKKKEPAPIEDPDELMDSPILNTRLALLGVCQGNRYQFDQRRRAKHSTMMLLYHLHNPTVPLYLYTCNECQSDILSGFRWHCPICPDFDLCHECKRGVVHQHQLECHKVKVSADTDNQAQKRSLNLFLESLVHNTTCDHKTCEKPECRKITELLRHRANCRVRASGGCDTCHRILCLLQMHARRCETKDCKVLYCDDLKRRIKENQRRKPAAAPVVIHEGTDNQAKPKIAVT